MQNTLLKQHGSAVRHWQWQRWSALLTLPLMIYCVYILGVLTTLEYDAARQTVAMPSVALPIAALITAGMFHAALGVQVIIEDYVPLANGRRGLIMFARLALIVIALVSLVSLGCIIF